MDDRVSAEGLAIADRIWAELAAISDDDIPFVAGQLLRMAQDLLGPERWSMTLERHYRQDEQLEGSDRR